MQFRVGLFLFLLGGAIAQLVCPDVPATGCSVCGDGLCITNPDAIFVSPVPPNEEVPCGVLQQAGLEGAIDLVSECPVLPVFITVVCGCMPEGSPTGAPIGMPTDAPVAPVTPAPVDPVTLAPVAPVTPAPVAPVTPAPVDPVTPAPVDPVTDAPVDPVTPAPVDPMITPAPDDGPSERPDDVPTPSPDQPSLPTDYPVFRPSSGGKLLAILLCHYS